MLIKEQELKIRAELKNQEIEKQKEILQNTSYEILPKPKMLVKSQSGNIGEKLYFKGIQQKERTDRDTQIMRLKIQESKANELTFKPIINISANEISRKYSTRLEDSLMQQKTVREEKLEKERCEKIAKEKELCPFNPNINPMSEKILKKKNRPSSKDKFEELYEEAKIRKQRQEDLNRQIISVEFPYRPEILENQPRSQNISDIAERLIKAKQDNYEKINEERKRLNEPIDHATGQELFKPLTGRPPRSERNRENIPIGDYLYMQKNKPKKLNQEHPHNPTQLESKNRSDRILQKAKIERYYEIYQTLSPNHNGEISAQGISLEKIDIEVFAIIRPLLEELESLNQSLNFEEFCESMDNLLRTLSPLEKNTITMKRKFKEDDANLSIHRVASVSKSQLSVDQSEIYERQMEIREKATKRLEMEREKKKAKELDGCTFQPRIKIYRPQQEFYDQRYKVNSIN